ncbi:MAG: pyrroline-5-carboxylate reductase [Oscillospiraceae bacterium]|nr:pyrroline-5-carboxylate reductase [Oscillospiraceae bacterium]
MKYGFIGCGNMGGALAKALSKTTTDILLADRAERAAQLAGELGCAHGTNAEAVACQRVFLGVKPQMMADVLWDLQSALKKEKPLLITMAAGLTIEKIEIMAGCRLPIIRIMPNTPVSVGKGVILYCHNDLVDEATLADFLNDMRFAGVLDPLDEKLIDAACAVSGCGPAFVYMFIEAMADGAVASGLPRDKALTYAAATLAGAAEMALVTKQPPQTLKDAVCSPGGSTIAGVRALEERGFRGTIIDAIIAAYKRNVELGN